MTWVGLVGRRRLEAVSRRLAASSGSRALGHRDWHPGEIQSCAATGTWSPGVAPGWQSRVGEAGDVVMAAASVVVARHVRLGIGAAGWIGDAIGEAVVAAGGCGEGELARQTHAVTM